MTKKAIEEGDKNTFDVYMSEARNVKSVQDLNNFIEKMQKKCEHGYITVVKAAAIIMMASFWTFNRGSQGGFTRSQLNCVFWELLEQLTYAKRPSSIIQYENMLYPQYRHTFDKTISSKVWNFLQKRAAWKLNEDVASLEVASHLKSIVDGIVPFGYSVKK